MHPHNYANINSILLYILEIFITYVYILYDTVIILTKCYSMLVKIKISFKLSISENFIVLLLVILIC